MCNAKTCFLCAGIFFLIKRVTQRTGNQLSASLTQSFNNFSWKYLYLYVSFFCTTKTGHLKIFPPVSFLHLQNSYHDFSASFSHYPCQQMTCKFSATILYVHTTYADKNSFVSNLYLQATLFSVHTCSSGNTCLIINYFHIGGTIFLPHSNNLNLIFMHFAYGLFAFKQTFGEQSGIVFWTMRGDMTTHKEFFQL